MGAGWDRAGQSRLPRAEGGGLHGWPAAPGPVSWQTPTSQEPWGRAHGSTAPVTRGNEPPVGGPPPLPPPTLAEPLRALGSVRRLRAPTKRPCGPLAWHLSIPAPLGFSQRFPQSLALQRGCLGLPVTQDGGVQETREEGWRVSVSVHVCKRAGRAWGSGRRPGGRHSRGTSGPRGGASQGCGSHEEAFSRRGPGPGLGFCKISPAVAVRQQISVLRWGSKQQNHMANNGGRGWAAGAAR